MSKKNIIVICTITLLLLAGALFSYTDTNKGALTDNAKDKLVWETIVLPELGGKTIEKVILTAWGGELKELDTQLHAFIMAELASAVYYASDRSGFGPTPELDLSLSLYFTDDTRLTLCMWPGGDTFATAGINEFTTQDHPLIKESRILIKNDVLAAWLQDYADESKVRQAYSLTIKSNVPLSQAFMGDTYIGIVPVELTLLPGFYRITIIPPQGSGYEAMIRELDVGPTIKKEVWIDLKKSALLTAGAAAAPQPAPEQPAPDRQALAETAGDQDEDVVLALHSAVSRATGIHFIISEERYKIEVKGEHKLHVLKQQLGQARLVDAPPKVREEQHYRLGLSFSSGVKLEYAYYFNEIKAEEAAYVDFEGDWYELPGTLTSLFLALAEYPDASAVMDAADATLLEDYGWTPFFLINTFEKTLPAKFQHAPGAFPTVLYWAYNNELNKDVGLDLSPYLGQKVDVRLYKIAELLPEFIHGPRRGSGRAVIVRQAGAVIGAWLDVGRHHAFACSLTGRSLEEITKKQWEEWIPGLINAADPLEQELAKLTPEEMIRAYYAALDRGDTGAAYACLSRRNLVSNLFSNMNNNYLYNRSYEDNLLGSSSLSNITGAEVLQLKRMQELEELHYPAGTRLYQVELNLEVKIPLTDADGPQTRFIALSKETPATGWRIDAIGTGP